MRLEKTGRYVRNWSPRIVPASRIGTHGSMIHWRRLRVNSREVDRWHLEGFSVLNDDGKTRKTHEHACYVCIYYICISLSLYIHIYTYIYTHILYINILFWHRTHRPSHTMVGRQSPPWEGVSKAVRKELQMKPLQHGSINSLYWGWETSNL